MHERFDEQTIFYQRPTVRLPLNLCDYEIRRRCLCVTIFGKAVLHFNSSVNKTEEHRKLMFKSVEMQGDSLILYPDSFHSVPICLQRTLPGDKKK